jgi:hypothetical protein
MHLYKLYLRPTFWLPETTIFQVTYRCVVLVVRHVFVT